MYKSRFILPAVAVSSALILGGFAASALASSAADSGAANQHKAMKAVDATLAAAQQANVQLSPLVVLGHRRVPLPVALQTIKKGLTLPWTNDRNDTRIRCRLGVRTGSHLPSVYCEGNRHHMIRLNRLHLALATGMGGDGGAIPARNVAFTNDVNVGALMGLVHKMPPADASYTFRVTGDDGKPILAYVIKRGTLVRTIHYVYKGKHPGDD